MGHLSKRERNAAEDLQARSGHVAFRKIEAPYLVGGAIRAAGEVYPSPTLVLTKSEVCRIMFVITESVLALRLSQARSGPWLLTSGLKHNRRANQEVEENFFIPVARNPLKSPDSKK